MVLTWEAKVIAAADAGAEANWKHKVTPDWGDLNTYNMNISSLNSAVYKILWFSQ